MAHENVADGLCSSCRQKIAPEIAADGLCSNQGETKGLWFFMNKSLKQPLMFFWHKGNIRPHL